MSPGSGPGGARSDPRGPKTAPRAARSEPRVRREPPKRLPKGIQIVVFVVSWGASGRPPGAFLEGFWARFWVLRASVWNDSGTIVGSILKRVEVDFQTCWGQSSLLSLLVKFDMFVLFLALQLACFLSLPRDRARKLREKRTRNSRNAPAPNARRARAAREQGLHATHHTRNLDARDALATLASLCLLVLCSGSSRHCLCFSPRVFRRLRCLRLSLLTRFAFLDSQVSL